MPKLPRPFYAASGSRVMIGGKSAEMIDADLAAGVARVGGFWREPSYVESYLHGAQALIDKGIADTNLDDVGLPVFYLQRHALELLLKSVLGWLHAIEDLQQLAKDLEFKPDLEKRDRQIRRHSHRVLLDMLVVVARAVGVPAPPADIARLVRKFSVLEKTETWARYGSSLSKTGDGVRHMQDEVVIPLVELQLELVALAETVLYRDLHGASYENTLADQWSELSSAIDHLKGLHVHGEDHSSGIF
ncbi:hypothetical protein [Pseudomonas sp. EMN2]|uniref:hypothetical protein n=1 Tax=Pseudomonas sp. EMN2 TaxID=2615212 RepID=UPI00129A1CD3|nr:hypothetical protein [Pseudomonas sp. EMN2]